MHCRYPSCLCSTFNTRLLSCWYPGSGDLQGGGSGGIGGGGGSGAGLSSRCVSTDDEGKHDRIQNWQSVRAHVYVHPLARGPGLSVRARDQLSGFAIKELHPRICRSLVN